MNIYDITEINSLTTNRKLIDFYTISIQKTAGCIAVQTQTFFFLGLVIEYSTSAVIVESSNPSVGHSPRITISFFLLPVCFDEILLFTSKITTFLPHSLFGSEIRECASNPIP